jgi:hypothetical protein
VASRDAPTPESAAAAIEGLRTSGPPRRIRALPRRILRAAQAPLASVNPRPVIVLGNQKAGTSAIAGLLAGATGSSVTLDLRNEQTARPAFIPCRLGQLPFGELVHRNRLDFSRDIVKEPNLSLLYPQIAEHFPDSPIVMIVRDPRDNIRSLLNWMRIPGDRPGVEERDPRTLTTVQRSVLDARWLGLPAGHYVESLAQRWNAIADVHLAHADRVRLVRYEEFCRDKPRAIAGIAASLGLAVTRDVSGEVDRQFQPRGDRSVTWPAFFGQNLSRITDACGDRMRVLGYAIGD